MTERRDTPCLPLDLPADVARILAAVRAAGGRPLIVGGAVRDRLLGLQADDFDIEVYGLGVEALVEALSAAGRVNAVGKSFGVLKVNVAGRDIDVSLPRRESKTGRGHRGFLVEPDADMTPHEAASRRDFTINALAVDPLTDELLDFHEGRRDLGQRVLRHVSPAFADDPLRVLRGVQFAGRFGLQAASETIALSRKLFGEYETLAIERIWIEWHKWATRSVQPSVGLRYLEQCGWDRAYPELLALRGCPQDPRWHPEGDVWTHTLYVVDSAARIAVRDGLAETDRAVLLLTALCHDLGKPTTTVREGDRVRSPGHAARRDEYASFLARIGCPARLAERIEALCLQHLAHIGFAGSARQVRRLARRLGAGGETIGMLARVIEADHSGRPPLEGGLPEELTALMEAARSLAAADRAPKPLLLGRHLLDLGVTPGPEMGRMLEAAFEAQLDGAFRTLDEAKSWARRELLGQAE